jgi:dolichol kinase
MVLFPLPNTVIGVQVASWIFGLAFLIADRWGSHESVAMPEVENQWGFGQLLAMIIVALPILPLMEIWSGEHASYKSSRWIML